MRRASWTSESFISVTTYLSSHSGLQSFLSHAIFVLILQSQPPLNVCFFAKLLSSVFYCKESVHFWALFIHLFLGAFLWAVLLDDDEETYSIPVEYWKDVSSIYKSLPKYSGFDHSGCWWPAHHSWPLCSFLLRILLSLTSLIFHRYYLFLIFLSCFRLWVFNHEKHDTSICSQSGFTLFDYLNILLSLMKVEKEFSLSFISSFTSFWLIFQFLPLIV